MNETTLEMPLIVFTSTTYGQKHCSYYQ